MAAFLDIFPQYGHKGLGKGAFAKQSAKEIGDALRNKERIGGHARAKQVRQNDVTRKSQQARGEGIACYLRDIA